MHKPSIAFLLLHGKDPFKVGMDFVFVSLNITYLLFSDSAKLDKMLTPLARSTIIGKEDNNAIFERFSKTSERIGRMKHETESAGLSSKKKKKKH